MWQKSFDSGEIPGPLKNGCIVPIHKGGDKGIAANYRPVTLTSNIIKIIERIIAIQIIHYMNHANSFNPHQHGFRKNWSCLSQLLEYYQLIPLCMEDGNEVAVIYLEQGF